MTGNDIVECVLRGIFALGGMNGAEVKAAFKAEWREARLLVDGETPTLVHLQVGPCGCRG